MRERDLQGSDDHRSPTLGQFSEKEIHEQLERILASPTFRASKRCQDLLRYAVEMTLRGHADELKERTIGLEVFGRPPSYDPSVDSTVRVKIGDVRRRLSLYYAEARQDDRLVIELPAGGYVPHFRTAPDHPAPVAVPFMKSRRQWPLVLALALAFAFVGLFLWPGRPGAEPMLHKFWGPAQRGSPVLICLSYVPVYGLKTTIEAAGQAPTRAEDFILRPSQFIGAQDSMAALKIGSALRNLGVRSTVAAGDATFHDLRSATSVLVGYSYTRWRDLNRGLRYQIDTSQPLKGITDRGKNTGWLNQTPNEDYALVARMLQPDTGTLMVLLAGIEGYGTEAASDLVSSEIALAAALGNAPKDWARKNLELVLHVRVISNAPGEPKVVASHYW